MPRFPCRANVMCRKVTQGEITWGIGKSIMRNIRSARDEGFRIVMFYVGVDSPDIANDRVAKRDALGGHFIPAETVARRYDASLANLVEAVPLCEEVYLYDNSVKLALQARFARGILMYYNPLEPMHPWVHRTAESLGYHEIAFL